MQLADRRCTAVSLPCDWSAPLGTQRRPGIVSWCLPAPRRHGVDRRDRQCRRWRRWLPSGAYGPTEVLHGYCLPSGSCVMVSAMLLRQRISAWRAVSVGVVIGSGLAAPSVSMGVPAGHVAARGQPASSCVASRGSGRSARNQDRDCSRGIPRICRSRAVSSTCGW